MSTNNISFEIKDNSAQVLAAFEEQVRLGLDAIGQTAEGYAKDETPVDTGRLRNSITFATAHKQSPANTNKHPRGQQDASPQDYKIKATPEEHSVYIGTNVEYAAAVEYKDMAHKTGKAHFLKDAATTHGSEYKEIMEKALKD